LVTIHDLNYKYSAKPRAQRRGHKRILRALRLHHQVASGSSFAAEDIKNSFQLEKPINVVLDGATSLVACPTAKPVGVLESPFLFHVSRMSASKNTACILDLIRGWPEMNFILAGRTHTDTKAIRDTLEREKLGNAQVLFDISEAEKAWLYENCVGFLFPSLAEGFGLPAVEAMHFGKPVFLSRLTSLPEIGGEHAFYFDTFDAEATKAVIVPAIEPAQALSRAEAVISHAARFTWTRCAAGYLAIYARMAGIPVTRIADVG
jgi:glycosyltransferase involved in cell wall biosynthesis